MEGNEEGRKQRKGRSGCIPAWSMRLLCCHVLSVQLLVIRLTKIWCFFVEGS
jgi:hypothetical protein